MLASIDNPMEATVPNPSTASEDASGDLHLHRIADLALVEALSAPPDSKLRPAAAMCAVLLHTRSYLPVADSECEAARNLIREINFALDEVPVPRRDSLRRARLRLEEVVDSHETNRLSAATESSGDARDIARGGTIPQVEG